MSNPKLISAVITTLNEQKYIEQCIKSLEAVVDEIVIIDSYSQDDTKSICENLDVTFYEREWMGYAETKNWGNKQASHAWILSMDADEVLSEELSKSLMEVKHNGLKENSVCKFNRLNNYCGKWIKYAGWYPDTKIRLFSKKNSKWVGEVHEVLEFSANQKEVFLRGDLLHYTIENKEDHIARQKKYNELAVPYKNKARSFLAAFATFLRMYILKLGVLDGKMGLQLCWISAKSKFERVR